MYTLLGKVQTLYICVMAINKAYLITKTVLVIHFEESVNYQW